jgi:putative nucleotide binding protein
MERHEKEEYATVLDFLPNGYPFDSRPSHQKTAIAQAIGKKHFVLLELVPKKGVFLQPNEDVYIGQEKRDKIHHINGKLQFSKLTRTAKSQLDFVVKTIVEKYEQRFVDFFNNAYPLSTRMHSIELLPGMGKKRMWEILDERKTEPFKSFADMKKRVKLMPDPKTAVIRRIMKELEGKEKHSLFVDA